MVILFIYAILLAIGMPEPFKRCKAFTNKGFKEKAEKAGNKNPFKMKGRG
jgi:hypothetical protein